MTIITIQDNKCWVCKGNKQITMHHALPRHLKPKNNIIIPICEKCHKHINSNDVTGLYSFAHKLILTSETTKKQAGELKALVENKIINGGI